MLAAARSEPRAAGPRDAIDRLAAGLGAAIEAAEPVALEREGARLCARARRRDDEIHIELHAEDADDPHSQAACSVILRPDGGTGHRSGFSVDDFAYALPADLPRIARLVDLLAGLLDSASLDARPLRDDWAACAARLDAIWRKAQARGAAPDRLVLVKHGSIVKLGLAAPTTRPGGSRVVGVEMDSDGEWRALSDYYVYSALRPTQARLAAVNSLSAHVKLDILAGAPTELLAQARAAFERIRKPFIPGHTFYRVRATPRRIPTVAVEKRESGWSLSTYRIGRDGGDDARFTIGDIHGKCHLSLSLRRPQMQVPALISMEEGEPLSVGRQGKDKTYSDPDLLDAYLRRLAELVLDLDPDWPDIVARGFEGEFDPAHPILAGLDVRQRHRAFFGAALGAPYRKARAAAERFAARRAKLAQAKEGLKNVIEQTPDGAIFGRFKENGNGRDITIKFHFSHEAYSGLCLVAPTDEPDAKRRGRILRLLNPTPQGYPFTPRHVIKLKRCESSDAVRFLPDGRLGSSERDFIEAAFRLSFELAPGARNPLLDNAVGHIQMLDFGAERHRVRVTQCQAESGVVLFAVGVVYRIELPLPAEDERRQFEELVEWNCSGCGFVVLRTPTGEAAWARPAALSRTLLAPEAEKALLAEAIHKLSAVEGPLNAALPARFEEAWAALVKELAAR
jgi:hypothetical protein